MAGSVVIVALKLDILNSALQVEMIDLQTNQVRRWALYLGALSARDIYKNWMLSDGKVTN